MIGSTRCKPATRYRHCFALDDGTCGQALALVTRQTKVVVLRRALSAVPEQTGVPREERVADVDAFADEVSAIGNS